MLLPTLPSHARMLDAAAQCCSKTQTITRIDKEVVAQHGAAVPVDSVEGVGAGGQQRQLPIPSQRPRERPHLILPAQPQARSMTLGLKSASDAFREVHRAVLFKGVWWLCISRLEDKVTRESMGSLKGVV